MKAIPFVIAILASAYFAYYTFQKQAPALKQHQLERFENLDILADRKKTDADLKEQVKVKEDELKKVSDTRDVLTQSLDTLKATGSELQRTVDTAMADLKKQEAEIASFDAAMDEVKLSLAGIGSGVTIETLPDQINQMEEKKIAGQKKIDELKVLIASAKKSLVEKRDALVGLEKRKAEIASRIAMNSKEAVVTAVNADWGFVVVGAGTNLGFVPNKALLVKRDGKTVAKLNPTSVESTQTVADFDFNSLQSGARVQVGDSVILEEALHN